MKRGLLILLAALAAGVLTALGVSWSRQCSAAPENWLRSEFGLTAEQAQHVAAVDPDYAKATSVLCERIRKSDERVATALKSSKSLTPEIKAAVAESNVLRAECAQRMTTHFYLVAEKLPAGQRDRYLAMVLPTAMNPDHMGAASMKK
ncbi:MAG TPA: periplasmic heavy metal sensor [Chthoniobacterales bacterium]